MQGTADHASNGLAGLQLQCSDEVWDVIAMIFQIQNCSAVTVIITSVAMHTDDYLSVGVIFGGRC